MSASVTANRIYARTPHGMTGQGRIAAEDVKGLAPDLLLLRGCKPITKTQTASGLAIPHGGMAAINDDVGAENRSHPVRACACFEVVMLPASTTKGNPLGLVEGDVVVVYNSLVDPLLGNELAIAPIDAVQFVLEWAKRPGKEIPPPPEKPGAALEERERQDRERAAHLLEDLKKVTDPAAVPAVVARFVDELAAAGAPAENLEAFKAETLATATAFVEERARIKAETAKIREKFADLAVKGL